jgi:tRNA/rRNA methyltransferase
MLSPAIILVQPQLGENIGAAARAMANFGLRDLRLVAPRDGWPNDKAFQMSSGAQFILEQARVFPDTPSAVADLRYLLGTSARDRRMIKPVDAPRDAVAHLLREAGSGTHCGILFGAERTGLTNEDIVLCDRLVAIPTAPDYASLNLAQALVVLAYEWFVAQAPEAGPKGTTGPQANPVLQPARPATREELHGFFNHLEQELNEADFWKNPDKKPLMWQNLRNIFTRSQLTEQEVRTLRGVVRCLVQGY